jgi:hypothetical protein
MKKFSFICALVSFSFITGCVTSEPPQQTIILERSELGRPTWVGTTRESEPSAEKWFLYEKTEIVRLDLGIRQAQAAALASHCQLISARMRFEIDDALSKMRDAKIKESKDKEARGPLLSAEAQSVVDSFLQNLAGSQSCPELELKDVYWELLRKPSPDGPKTSYSVYVLLRLKQLPFDEVLAMTAESLKLSGQAEVQPLAEVLRGRMSTSSE